jgi:hypothetical protein
VEAILQKLADRILRPEFRVLLLFYLESTAIKKKKKTMMVMMMMTMKEMKYN